MAAAEEGAGGLEGAADDGGVGGDTVDFAEFRRRVSKKCTVMDSQAFYDFNDRRGKVRLPTCPAPFQTVAVNY